MVTTAQVIALTRLRHLTPEQAAERMGLTVAEVMEVARMGSIMMTYPPDPPRLRPTDAEREAMIDRMPKKMQDRLRRDRGED